MRRKGNRVKRVKPWARPCGRGRVWANLVGNIIMNWYLCIFYLSTTIILLVSVFFISSSGEYRAFQLAQRSFYTEVCLIQSGFKEEQFLTVAKQTLEFQYNKRRKEENSLLEIDILPQVIYQTYRSHLQISLYTGIIFLPSCLQHWPGQTWGWSWRFSPQELPRLSRPSLPNAGWLSSQ